MADSNGNGTRHYGKFRGIVSDNDDPRHQGRLKAKVPDVLGEVETGWALPAAAYAGSETGVFAIPSPDAGVWIEFEAGDVSRPIWSGAWWASDKAPKDESGSAATPDVKIIRSEEGLMLALHDDSKTIAVSDSDGKNIVKIEVQGGKVTVKASTKVILEAPSIELVENASHPLVFGDQLNTYLQQIVQMFNSHMHPGQACAVGPVTPAPPTPMLSAPTPDMLSNKVKTG